MRCPVCDQELRTTNRRGVELGRCPRCLGAWLSPGALDKLLGRARPNGGCDEGLPGGGGPGSWPPEIEFYDFG